MKIDDSALSVSGLSVGYGSGTVLRDVSLELPAGTVTSLVGRNGVGKTTLVHAIMGLIRPQAGAVVVGGKDVAARPPHVVARQGVALVPQGRRVIPGLTAVQNLALAPRRHGAWTQGRVYETFPRLAERRTALAGNLSGGEQQMLAIARALVTNPSVILLDEPSDGLAPSVVDEVHSVLELLARDGITCLVVEQNLALAIGVADHVMAIAGGQIHRLGTGDQVRADPSAVMKFLAVV